MAAAKKLRAYVVKMGLKPAGRSHPDETHMIVVGLHSGASPADMQAAVRNFESQYRHVAFRFGNNIEEPITSKVIEDVPPEVEAWIRGLGGTGPLY